MPFIRNAWYVAGLSSELSQTAMIARTILEEPIILFRDSDGRAAALFDRCPHRFAPLHRGSLTNGIVACAYHGLQFNHQGACVLNPHGNGMIPKEAPLKTYPLIERYDLVWIWMGDPEDADGDLIPDLTFLDGVPDTARTLGYLPTAANYLLMTDNIMDLSHADFLHKELLGTHGAVTGSIPKTETKNNTVSSAWKWQNSRAMGVFAPFLPDNGMKSDGWLNVAWSSPTHMKLSTGASAPGASASEEVAIHAFHTMTPADETNTHYFYAAVRNFLVHDEQIARLSAEGTYRAFAEEDKPILEATQRNMGNSDFWALKPWILSGDGAAVRVRRAIERAIREESRT